MPLAWKPYFAPNRTVNFAEFCDCPEPDQWPVMCGATNRTNIAKDLAPILRVTL